MSTTVWFVHDKDQDEFFVAKSNTLALQYVCETILRQAYDSLQLAISENDQEHIDYLKRVNEEIRIGEWKKAIDIWNGNYDLFTIRRIVMEDAAPLLELLDFSAANPQPIQTPSPTVVTNDHTCIQCGNSSCSKTEKSCWKCGCQIT